MPNFSKRASNNDIAGLTVRSIEFTGDFNWGYQLTGLGVGLTNGIHQNGSNLQVNTGENRVGLNITLLADQTWSVTPKEAAGLAELTGPIYVSGSIAGNFGITKTGPGRMSLFAPTNSYSGQTLVQEGSLLIDSAEPASRQVVASGAVLASRGVTGPITVLPGGTTIAGLVLRTNTAPALAHVAGDLVLTPGSTMASNLDIIPPKEGGEPCGRFDVQGSVVIAGANLALKVRQSVPAGSSCVVIDNEGSIPVIGSFNGLSEGTVFAVDGVSLRITYRGGDGNDVVLTAV